MFKYRMLLKVVIKKHDLDKDKAFTITHTHSEEKYLSNFRRYRKLLCTAKFFLLHLIDCLNKDHR